MEENTKQKETVKNGNGLKIAGFIVVAVLVCATLAISILSFLSVKKTNETVVMLDTEFKDMYGLNETETQENDVKIGTIYEIKSTEHISDAYISGDTSALSDKDKETLDMAATILDLVITDGMTDFEKEKAVYDWMCSALQGSSSPLTVIPTGQGTGDNPYDVLKYHNAVCVGYATTFRLFMQMLEIPCMVVHNVDCYHSWDLVQIEGDWYHVDIYNDVGRGDYAAFNLNDSIRSAMQTWDTDFFPAATSMKYNFDYMRKKPAEDIYEVPALLRAAIDEHATGATIEFVNGITDEEAEKVEGVISTLNDYIAYSDDSTLPTYAYVNNWYRDENTQHYIMFVYFYYVESYEEETVDDEQMNAALEEAFGDKIDFSEEDLYDSGSGSYDYGMNDLINDLGTLFGEAVG